MLQVSDVRRSNKFPQFGDIPLATDTLAAAAGITTVGLVIIRSAKPKSRRVLGLLTISVALTWFIRPAYLFYVALVPVLGAILVARRHWGASDRPLWRREFLVLCLAVGIPLCCWCTLRWIVVGRFGVVSFGGYNLVGVTGQFLDEDVATELPAEQQPLARAALKRHRDLAPDELVMPDASPLNYTRMESNYDTTIWEVFTPAARDLYGDDDVAVNTHLKGIAVEIIRVRPASYVLWLAKALRQGVRKIVSDFVVNPVGLLLTLLCVMTSLALTLGKCRSSATRAHTIHSEGVSVLLAATIVYSALSLLTVIVVCPPLGRMTDACSVLLPALVTAALIEQVATLVSRRTPTDVVISD